MQWWLTVSSYDSAKDQGRDRGILLTLEKGLKVLESIARARGQATPKSISEELPIHLATIYQVLRTLQANGYIERHPGSKYRLGPRLGFLLDRFETIVSPPPQVLTVLSELHAELDESVYVSLRHGSHIAIAAQLEGTRAVRVGALQVGFNAHPHARATSKCLLAYTDTDQLDAVLGTEPLAAITPHTIVTREALVEDFAAIRERGYALDLEEYQPGVGCIGVVLVDNSAHAIGAIGVSVPLDRFRASQDELVAGALAAGKRASEALGYRGHYPPTRTVS
jgi:DNA-binding IclR family transcriptional regulator